MDTKQVILPLLGIHHLSKWILLWLEWAHASLFYVPPKGYYSQANILGNI